MIKDHEERADDYDGTVIANYRAADANDQSLAAAHNSAADTMKADCDRSINAWIMGNPS